MTENVERYTHHTVKETKLIAAKSPLKLVTKNTYLHLRPLSSHFLLKPFPVLFKHFPSCISFLTCSTAMPSSPLCSSGLSKLDQLAAWRNFRRNRSRLLIFPFVFGGWMWGWWSIYGKQNVRILGRILEIAGGGGGRAGRIS